MRGRMYWSERVAYRRLGPLARAAYRVRRLFW